MQKSLYNSGNNLENTKKHYTDKCISKNCTGQIESFITLVLACRNMNVLSNFDEPALRQRRAQFDFDSAQLDFDSAQIDNSIVTLGGVEVLGSGDFLVFYNKQIKS